jgi:hypothetical protein
VIGVDISAYCLKLASEAAAKTGVKIDLRKADMLDLQGVPQCNAAYTLGNAFGYLDYDGTLQFARGMAAALRPGGRWLIDTGVAAESILPTLKPELEFTLGGIHTKIANKYLADQSCLETTFVFTRDGQTQTLQNWSFIFTAAEIRRLLTTAGFKVIALYGSTSGEPYTLGSGFLFVVGEKV